MANFEPTIKLEHTDSRGEIYSISLPGDKELMLLHSKAGALRGGHAHDCDELVALLTGKIFYTKREERDDQDAAEWTEVLTEGDTSFVPKGVFHLGEFLKDSWLLEWKIGTKKGDWENIDYKPYRDKVNANVAG